MLKWSEQFDTRIDVVDEQHRRLVELLNELYSCSLDRHADLATVDGALETLCEYAHTHFRDEEQLMEASGVDPRHVSLHKMEHSSFVYDIERMRNHLSPDESAAEAAKKLVKFVTSWLTYHILGIDKLMAGQIRSIAGGSDAAAAYAKHEMAQLDTPTIRLVLDAVLQMWREATERAHRLEEEVAALRAEPSPKE